LTAFIFCYLKQSRLDECRRPLDLFIADRADIT